MLAAAAATVVLLAVLLQVLFKRPGLPFRHQGQQLYELVDAAGCGVCAREHSTARGCADMPTTAHARLVPANTSVQALVRTSVCTGTPTVIQKCLQSVVEPDNTCHLGACSESSRAARGLNITFMRRAFGGRAAFPQPPPPGSELPGFGPPPVQAGNHGHSAPTVNLEFYPRDDEEHQQQGGSSSSRGEFGDVYGLRAAVREVLADYQATQGCGVAAHMAADVGGHSLALHAFQLQARGSTFSWHTDRLGGLGQFFITASVWGRARLQELVTPARPHIV